MIFFTSLESSSKNLPNCIIYFLNFQISKRKLRKHFFLTHNPAGIIKILLSRVKKKLNVWLFSGRNHKNQPAGLKDSCVNQQKREVRVYHIYNKNRRFSCVQANFGAQDSCFDLIGSHQLRIPCSTRSGTDELNLMTMKGHQIRSNSAYGAEHKVAVHNNNKKKHEKTGNSRSPPLVAQ